MWRRSILTLGFLSLAVLVWSGVVGLQLQGVSDDRLPRHVLAGFGAFLLLAFVDLWLLIFLAASGWAARATVRERQTASSVPAAVAAASRRAWPWALAGLLSSVGVVASGALAFTATLPIAAHAGAVAVALAAQVFALWRANGAIREHDRQFARLAAEAA